MLKIILYINQAQRGREEAQGQQITLSDENRALVQSAVRLKEEQNGHLTVILYGPDRQKTLLREALARGCDEALLLERSRESDQAYQPVFLLAAEEMKRIGYDLILTGYRTLDGYSSYIGPQIAEYLGIPQVSFADRVCREGDVILAERETEGMVQTVECGLPCLLTLTNSCSDGRPMLVTEIIRACEKEIRVCTAQQIARLLLESHFQSPYQRIEQQPISFEKKQCDLRYTIELENGDGGLIQDVISSEEAADLIVEWMRERGILR